MKHYNYLIIGGGMTGDAAIRGIREVDPNGSIGLIGAEPHPPYGRPPLTKKLWQGKPVDKIWLGTDKRNVDLHLGRTVQSLDPNSRRVTDDQGNVFSFDRLLLATGGTPRKLPFGQEEIIYFRTFDDYMRLRGLTNRAGRIAVLGGGFIGSEIAAALATNQQSVVMIVPEAGVGARIFPADVVQFLNRYYADKGVEVLSEQSLTGVERRGEQLALKLQSVGDKRASELAVDAVVGGIGIVPNVDLAKQAALNVDNGIIVDEYLRTSHPDIYAAGDVASFYSPALDKRMRVEHEDNANTMGKLAGRNMAGRLEPYDHLPMFYSDLFDLGYEAVGELDSRLDTQIEWEEPYQKGIIYYREHERVRGVLLWNVWEKVDWARQLIRESNQAAQPNVAAPQPA